MKEYILFTREHSVECFGGMMVTIASWIFQQYNSVMPAVVELA